MSNIVELSDLNTLIEKTGRNLPYIQLIRPNGIAKVVNRLLLKITPCSLLDCRPFGGKTKLI